MSVDITVTKGVLEKATLIAKDLQKSLGNKEYQYSLYSYLDVPKRVKKVMTTIDLLGNVSDKKILEIGSGMGMFVVAANQLGLDCVGVEPSAGSYKNLLVAQQLLLQANGLDEKKIIDASAEQLPFDDNSFDAVVSFQVIEHVLNPERVFGEALRVLKPGGVLYFEMPNYFSFFEGHYGIIWLPFLAFSKKLARIYVKLLGKNPDFLNEVNFITPFYLRSILGKSQLKFSIKNSVSSSADISSINVKGSELLPSRSENRHGAIAKTIFKIIHAPGLRLIIKFLQLSESLVVIAKKS
jgi:ubiquinone/menaquinone biosynthesis C-methylase UbiE